MTVDEATEAVQEIMETEAVVHELAEAYRRDMEVVGSLDDFVVKDEPTADWVVAKVNAAADEIARLNEQHATRVNAIKRRHEFLFWRFNDELKRYAAAQLEGQKRRSVVLPHGTIGFRRVKESLDIIDPDRALAAAKRDIPAAVKVVERLVKTPIYEHLKTTGELLDGCELRAAEDRFYVK